MAIVKQLFKDKILILILGCFLLGNESCEKKVPADSISGTWEMNCLLPQNNPLFENFENSFYEFDNEGNGSRHIKLGTRIDTRKVNYELSEGELTITDSNGETLLIGKAFKTESGTLIVEKAEESCSGVPSSVPSVPLGFHEIPIAEVQVQITKDGEIVETVTKPAQFSRVFQSPQIQSIINTDLDIKLGYAVLTLNEEATEITNHAGVFQAFSRADSKLIEATAAMRLDKNIEYGLAFDFNDSKYSIFWKFIQN